MKAKYLTGLGILLFLAGFATAGITISANDAVREFFIGENISITDTEGKTLEEVVELFGGRMQTRLEYNCAYNSPPYEKYIACLGNSEIRSSNIILIEEQETLPPIQQPKINDDRNICEIGDTDPNCEVWK